MPIAPQINYNFNSVSFARARSYAMGHTLGAHLIATVPGNKPSVVTANGDTTDACVTLMGCMMDGLLMAGVDVCIIDRVCTLDHVGFEASRGFHDAGLYFWSEEDGIGSAYFLDHDGLPMDVMELHKRVTTHLEDVKEPKLTELDKVREKHLSMTEAEVYWKYLSTRMEEYGDWMLDVDHMTVVLDTPIYSQQSFTAQCFQAAMYENREQTKLKDLPVSFALGKRLRPSHEMSEVLKPFKNPIGFSFSHDGRQLTVYDAHGVQLPHAFVASLLTGVMSEVYAGECMVVDYRMVYGPLLMANDDFEVHPSNPAVSEILDDMRQTGAVFGADGTGFYIFRELGWQSSATFAAMLLTKLMNNANGSLDDLIKHLREHYATFGPVDRDLTNPTQFMHTLEDVLKQRELEGELSRLYDGLSLSGNVDTGSWHVAVQPRREGISMTYEAYGSEGVHDIARAAYKVVEGAIDVALTKENENG